jgi:D-alanyl-D-alanine carboxypeptidase
MTMKLVNHFANLDCSATTAICMRSLASTLFMLRLLKNNTSADQGKITIMSSLKYLKLLSLTSLSLGLLPAIALHPTLVQSTPAATQPRSSKSNRLLDDRVKGIMERQHIPGMAVVVIKNGQVQELKGYGVTDITTKQPVSSDTKFAIGSITKPFTAMAIMMLVEEGKVDLDKPVSQYLSDLPTQWAPLTLRQLLSHTSGISEEGSWRKFKQPKDLLKMAKPELDFPTGESWSYSNSGFVLAGLVLERVSGQTYGDFLRDRIFTPLGMKQTQAKLASVPNLATGYIWNDRLNKIDLTDEYDSAAYSAGNIISTASDMAKWVQALDPGKFLNAASYRQLWTDTALKNGRSTGYGLGWEVGSFNGHPFTQHGGNVGGYSSGLYRYPNDQLDVIVLSNNGNVIGELVASAIAGVYDPTISLVGFNAQTGPNPAFTQRFLALLQGNDKALPFAPEFQLQRKNNRGKFLSKWMKGFRKVESLEFLHVEAKNGDRTYYYRTSLKGKLVYAFATVTTQGQIASYGAVDQP